MEVKIAVNARETQISAVEIITEALQVLEVQCKLLCLFCVCVYLFVVCLSVCLFVKSWSENEGLNFTAIAREAHISAVGIISISVLEVRCHVVCFCIFVCLSFCQTVCFVKSWSEIQVQA